MIAIDHRESIATGIDQEAFEARDSSAREREDIRLVVRNSSSPGGPIHHGFTGGSATLLFERSDGRGFGKAVKRHVDKGCETACRGSPRTGGESLPLGAPGFIQVYVRVDQPRKYRTVAQVNGGGSGREFGRIADGMNHDCLGLLGRPAATRQRGASPGA